MIYCIVPRDLAPRLHERLRRSYRDDPGVEVVVEQRNGERRGARERRAAPGTAATLESGERRRIRNAAGRRVGERRAAVLRAVGQPDLPRPVRRHADRLVFVERLAPNELECEDLDTGRLVTRIQAGDEALFGDLYMRYFDRVYAQLQIILRDPHDAEDATQEVFIRVMKGIGGYELRAAPFRAWLYTVVRNHALSLLERHSAEVRDPTELDRRRDETEFSTDLDALDWLTDREMLILIERLPLAQRQVIILRYMLDLPSTEIARLLGASPDAVRQMHHRALKFLEARLTSLGRRQSRSRQPVRRTLRQARVVRARRFALTHYN